MYNDKRPPGIYVGAGTDMRDGPSVHAALPAPLSVGADCRDGGHSPAPLKLVQTGVRTHSLGSASRMGGSREPRALRACTVK